ncbi:MAG: response regulator [Spirochaetaceae bacterium]|jgi:putative two-component system response regulator|nr:response regulator [Spirochaetaceae bacterium]
MEKRKKIVLVDDSIINLKIGRKVLGRLYDVYTVPSGEKLLNLLKTVVPNLILLDIDMPVMNGFEVLSCLKADNHTRDIPVIFLSSVSDSHSEDTGLSMGAVDYVSKPYTPSLLCNRIEMQFLLKEQREQILDYENKLTELRQEKEKILGDFRKNILKILIDLVDRRNEITNGHVERTRRYIEVLLDVLLKNNIYQDVINTWEKEFLLQSTLLYDLGKLSVKDTILSKPGKLTEDEFNEVKKHTLLGVKILEDIETDIGEPFTETSLFSHAKVFAGTHHERWDGTGYPYGLSGYNIPLQGRIMAIADVYDALVAERPYKKSCTHEEATAIILQGKGTHFDPVLVNIFISVSDEFRRISREIITQTSPSGRLETPCDAKAAPKAVEPDSLLRFSAKSYECTTSATGS